MMISAELVYSFDSILQLIGALIVFIIVLGITYLTTRLVGNYQKNQMTQGNIKLIESMRISNNKFLQIVQVGSKYFLIAVCKDTITTIGELDAQELVLQANDQKNDDFKEILNKFKDVKLKK